MSARRQREAAHQKALKEFDSSGRLFPGGPFQGSLHVVRRETMPLVATHALLGDDEARTLMDAVAGYLGRCNGSAASPKAPLCLTCEATFGEGASPAAVVVAVPVKVGPVSVGSGVCKACAGRLSDREISEAWARSLKWPGLQITERVS